MADTDGWHGPRSNDEQGFGRLLLKLGDLERRVAEVERGAPLRAAGISADEDGLTVGSSLSILGNLYVNRDGVPDLPGYLRAYLDANSGRTAIRLIPPRQEDSLETRLTMEGPTPGSPGVAALRAGGQVSLSGGDTVFVSSAGGQVQVTGNESVYLTSETGSAYVTADEGHVVLTAGDGNVLLTGDVVGFRSPNGSGGWAVDAHTTNSRFTATADNGFRFNTTSGSHQIHVTGDDIGVDAPNRLYVAANLHATGNLSCGGTKPFIIDHPLHADKSLVHAATETPIASIEYPWPEPVTLDENGEAELTLPDYFEALAADDYRAVWVQAVGRPFATGADLVVDGKTTVYGEPGRQVFVKVSARRGDDAGQFEVEIPRIQPPSEEAS